MWPGCVEDMLYGLERFPAVSHTQRRTIIVMAPRPSTRVMRSEGTDCVRAMCAKRDKRPRGAKPTRPWRLRRLRDSVDIFRWGSYARARCVLEELLGARIELRDITGRAVCVCVVVCVGCGERGGQSNACQAGPTYLLPPPPPIPSPPPRVIYSNTCNVFDL